MNEVQLQNLFLLLRRPIIWDPIPWWITIDKDRIAKFNEIQVRLNTQMAALQAEKVKELTKLVDMPIK